MKGWVKKPTPKQTEHEDIDRKYTYPRSPSRKLKIWNRLNKTWSAIYFHSLFFGGIDFSPEF